MSRDDDPRLNSQKVSAGWVLVQLAGMRFINANGRDAYDYMKSALLSQPLPKPKIDRTLRTLTPSMLHVLRHAVDCGQVAAGNMLNVGNGRIVKVGPSVIHALERRGYLERDPVRSCLTSKITDAGRQAWESRW